MKTRFMLIIAMLIVLFGAWLYLSYQISRSYQAKLDDLSQLPVYAYISDTTKVAIILQELQPITAIESVVHETAAEASSELLEAYGLPLNEDMISDYSFPDIITITLKPINESLQAKATILRTLRAHVTEAEIDSQASAYSNVAEELKLINRQSLLANIIIAVLFLLIFVFSRTSFELHVLLTRKGKTISVVDKIRHAKQGIWHTWTMLLIPLPLCIAGYFILVYSLKLPYLLPYWVFGAQFAAALIGTLITHFTLHTFEHEAAYLDNPIKVISAEPIIGESDETLDT